MPSIRQDALDLWRFRPLRLTLITLAAGMAVAGLMAAPFVDPGTNAVVDALAGEDAESRLGPLAILLVALTGVGYTLRGSREADQRHRLLTVVAVESALVGTVIASYVALERLLDGGSDFLPALAVAVFFASLVGVWPEPDPGSLQARRESLELRRTPRPTGEPRHLSVGPWRAVGAFATTLVVVAVGVAALATAIGAMLSPISVGRLIELNLSMAECTVALVVINSAMVVQLRCVDGPGWRLLVRGVMVMVNLPFVTLVADLVADHANGAAVALAALPPLAVLALLLAQLFPDRAPRSSLVTLPDRAARAIIELRLRRLAA
jgi:hypothetical protein